MIGLAIGCGMILVATTLKVVTQPEKNDNDGNKQQDDTTNNK